MIKKPLPDLSKAEYSILRVIWKQGDQTVREVHDQLKQTNRWAYTTTKTMMDRMVNKKFLTREMFHGIYLYKPLITRPAGLARMIHFFADHVLEMDSNAVVAMFARSKVISAEEIEELEKYLESIHHEEN